MQIYTLEKCWASIICLSVTVSGDTICEQIWRNLALSCSRKCVHVIAAAVTFCVGWCWAALCGLFSSKGGGGGGGVQACNCSLTAGLLLMHFNPVNHQRELIETLLDTLWAV